MLENILNNVLSYSLDLQQRKIVLSKAQSLLVVAGAGSGKTLTIIGKIRYLIEIEKIKENEILCISFTKDATNNLKSKIKSYYGYNINIFTFHKLSLEILNQNNIIYEICSSDYLEYVIDEFFSTQIYNYLNVVKQVLKYFKVRIGTNPLDDYKKIYSNNKNKIKMLENLVAKFIHLFKSNGYNIEKFSKIYKKIFLSKKKNFIKIVLNIYIFYVNELNSSGKIDFDDMILYATDILKKGGVCGNYKYIIIDEYQDTSYIRYNLIKEIINKTKSKFMAVGDDFQSIYRFSGCDLDIFLNFNKYFSNSELLKIENTYRNSKELINISGSFIMKNKSQIKKELYSNKSINKPLKIIYFRNKCNCLKQVIENIKGNIMILSRNNIDIYSYIDDNFILENDGKIIYKKDDSINIKYLTVHSSKGLECDNIIIINMVNGILGFPNKIVDDSILKLVTCNKDKYLYEEERRLFYVALTRTKNSVYLFTKKGEESIFIKEIINDFKYKIEIKKET